MKKTKTQVGALHGPGKGQRTKVSEPHVWIIDYRVGCARIGSLCHIYRSRKAADEAAKGYRSMYGPTKFRVVKYVLGGD